MKTFYTTVIILVFIFTEMYAQTATPPTTGDGSSGNPYQIATLENLYWIAASSTRWATGICYIQTADINASETSGWPDGGWTPIGNTTNLFRGTFDGQKHIIDSLYISRSGISNQGLFGYTYSPSIITNVYLTDANITGGSYVGALIGRSGYSAGTNGGSVMDCYSSGSVNASSTWEGGLIGISYNSTIERCYSTCSVGGNNNTGGLIGETDNGTISNCYGRGNVTSSGYAGGLIGKNVGATINNCYSTGSMAYASAKGLIGLADGGSVNNCFWDTETSGKLTSAGGTGKTTTEMKTLTTFTDASWDFEAETVNGTNNYWDMDLSGSYNNGYPFLSFQNGGATLLPVELTSFNATVSMTGCAVELRWLTETEVNNYGFEIERRKVVETLSCGVVEWAKVGFVQGSGTSNTPNEYSYSDSKLTGEKYEYRLKQIDLNGSYKYSSSVEVSFMKPTEFSLSQNYPNPFNPSTTIQYDIPNVGTRFIVSMKIYDIMGREVAMLVNEIKEAGSYEVTLDASKLASGVYFYRIQAGNFATVKKLLLMK